MSIDILHGKIRKLKNPLMVDFGMKEENIPADLITQEASFVKAYERFCVELLEELKDAVPAVRFPFDAFALLGTDGLEALARLLEKAKELDYYVLLDGPAILSPWAADRAAKTIFEDNKFPCDGLLISPYIGSDALKPFIEFVKDGEKDLFILVHSANKSSVELQDLLTGSRHVYSAAAEMVNRFGEQIIGKCGYSRVCAAASAANGEQLRTLRGKHNRTFLLVDGIDYPSGNAKNCSYAFDRFGFGAVVCAGPSVTAAWQENEERNYLTAARQGVERIKKNLNRYFSIM